MMQNSSVEDTYFGSNGSIRFGDKLLDLSTPIVMGIVNATPDSFYEGSRVETIDAAISRAKEMVAAGAQIVDVGGYSSRPNAEDITVTEELNRVWPIISELRRDLPDTIISIDTFRSEVAEKAILAGANMINDISGFEIDPKIVDIAAKYQVPYVLMHTRGTPQTMQSMTDYDNLFREMSLYFSRKIEQLKAAGLKDIILDPGFGFAKTIDQNYEILENLEAFQLFGKPILAGLSRKSMIYKKLGITPEESLEGTIALNKIALEKGAKILRVHDVKEAVELVKSLK
jgi:dihydropteroate synthase